MLKWLLFLFIVVPLLELYLLLWLGSLIGFWPTLGIVIVTGVVGGILAKREGLKVWREWRRALDELRRPEQGVIDGLLVLLGGALLITPGVITDTAGLLLLVPWVRRRVAAKIRQKIDQRIANAGMLDVHAPFVVDEARDVIETTGEAVPVQVEPSERR